MAASIVRLECEAEELRAEVAMLREERNILARAKAAVTEGGTGNSKVERPEPSPHLKRKVSLSAEAAFEKIHHKLGWPKLVIKLERERDEAREKAERYRLTANAMMAKLHELQTYADKLADGLPTGMLPRDVQNLREANAGLAEDLQKAEQERDEARVQFGAAEGLGMALVKTIDELRTEKAELVVKLVNLQGRSRRATLDEISESVREKFDPEYEFGGRDE